MCSQSTAAVASSEVFGSGDSPGFAFLLQKNFCNVRNIYYFLAISSLVQLSNVRNFTTWTTPLSSLAAYYLAQYSLN